LDAFGVLCLGFAVAVVAAWPGIHGSGRDLDLWTNLMRFAGRFWPPDLSIAPEIASSLVETARIAVVATAIAALISLPLALAATRRIVPWWVVAAVRLGLNAIRTIPSLIWALLAVAVVGANPLAGVIALTGYSIGYLAKFFSETIDSADMASVEALRALGCTRLQAFRWGLWPSVRPALASHVLWMTEYNLRSAAIIGYVGAGGIGLQLHTYQEYARWDRFGTVLLAILALVVVLDLLGVWLRRRLTA
jgi:phosphonate transport system permease protein